MVTASGLTVLYRFNITGIGTMQTLIVIQATEAATYQSICISNFNRGNS